MLEIAPLSPAMRPRVQAAFVAHSAASDLMWQASTAPAGIAASRLYRFAMAGGTGDDALQQALRADLTLRRGYCRLQQSLARYRMPALRAAHSDAFPPRRMPGCRLRVEPSAADERQFYLIIELDDQPTDRARPEALVLVDRDGHCHHFRLPGSRHGVIQQVVAAASELLHLLRDPQTEVLLR